MQSISPDCQELKNTYDTCFNKWFAENFLKGSRVDTCAPLFKVYQDCVKKAIKDKGIDLWEIEKDVLNTDSEKKPPKDHKAKKLK